MNNMKTKAMIVEQGVKPPKTMQSKEELINYINKKARLIVANAFNDRFE
jgi:hypothetical protein